MPPTVAWHIAPRREHTVPKSRGHADDRVSAPIVVRHALGVSDDYIRLIPTTATWQPNGEAAEAATAYVAGLFAAPQGSADEVVHEYYGEVVVIDSGVNTSSAKCGSCGAHVDLEWVFEVIGDRADDLRQLDVAVPCCGETCSLNDLEYDWPMGFASFEIGVLNGTRDAYELQPDELERVSSLLGHPVRQVSGTSNGVRPLSCARRFALSCRCGAVRSR